jgi:hypothetical protein
VNGVLGSALGLVAGVALFLVALRTIRRGLKEGRCICRWSWQAERKWHLWFCPRSRDRGEGEA